MEHVIQATDIKKKFKGFELSIPQLNIPKGFATALIGENGAGKSTLLNILAGIRLDYKGEVSYFVGQQGKVQGSMETSGAGQSSAGRGISGEGQTGASLDDGVQEHIGYTGPGSYFLPHWTVKQVEEISALLFENFHRDRFQALCRELGIIKTEMKEVKSLSDGNRMKLMLAAVLARDTELLILDEPASPLDPLMRDKLCDIMREYLEQGAGERSVFFSTHNIADMENVTDYCLIMEHGTIVEQGFVEDLKEKYILVKGEAADAERAKGILYTMTKSAYGFEGICLAENLDKLAGMDVTREVPTLSQISVAVMKANTSLKL